MNNLNLITAISMAIEAMDVAEEKMNTAYRAAGYSFSGVKENRISRFRLGVSKKLSKLNRDVCDVKEELISILGDVQKDTASRVIDERKSE